MMSELATPFAWAVVIWLAPAEGGRKTGPPSAPVYAANCSFPAEGENDVIADGPTTATIYSPLLAKEAENDDGSWVCAIDFLARDLVSACMLSGTSMLVMEGPRSSGRAFIIQANQP